MLVAADGLTPRWKIIEKTFTLHRVLKPDKRSVNCLKKKNIKSCHRKNIYPTALWNSNQTLEIQMCIKPQVSSHFSPNRKFLDRFPNSARFDVEYINNVKCMKLDDIQVASIDFIKIDVQGGELSVLEGATKNPIKYSWSRSRGRNLYICMKNSRYLVICVIL